MWYKNGTIGRMVRYGTKSIAKTKSDHGVMECWTWGVEWWFKNQRSWQPGDSTIKYPGRIGIWQQFSNLLASGSSPSNGVWGVEWDKVGSRYLSNIRGYETSKNMQNLSQHVATLPGPGNYEPQVEPQNSRCYLLQLGYPVEELASLRTHRSDCEIYSKCSNKHLHAMAHSWLLRHRFLGQGPIGHQY